MQETMTTLTSFLAGTLLILLLLQSSAPAYKGVCGKICNNVIGEQPAGAAKPPPLTDNARDELLMGYDLLTDIFNGQSKLWLVPIVRRMSRGTPLLSETTEIIQKLVDSGNTRKRELLTTPKLRSLAPNVSKSFVDPNPPNQLIESIGKDVAWNVMQDLSTRGEEFDLNFVLVQMASARIVASVASGMLKFESNVTRRQWLKDVTKEYALLRAGVRDVVMDFVRGDRIFLGGGRAIRPSI